MENKLIMTTSCTAGSWYSCGEYYKVRKLNDKEFALIIEGYKREDFYIVVSGQYMKKVILINDCEDVVDRYGNIKYENVKVKKVLEETMPKIGDYAFVCETIESNPNNLWDIIMVNCQGEDEEGSFISSFPDIKRWRYFKKLNTREECKEILEAYRIEK